MKKLLALVFASLMVLAMLAGCRGKDSGAAASGDYKIGIITGTVSQNEEEFGAAQNMIEKYGADVIVTDTYPDNFSTETETTISKVTALADDPDVKAIVFVQAVPGACAAIDKVRETRPDMLFICGVAAEDPATIASKADIVLLVDEIGMGTTVPTQAKSQGATTLIHYSFARHLSYATIAARRAIMMETCEELGIDFVDVNAPDPTGDSGIPGAQQFILEDVPRQVEKYGVDTAFFSTNCSMQEPLIRSVLEQGAILPQQCCPSPYHGYPGALNIEVEGHEGDVDYLLDQISQKIEEGGNSGRMSTWTLPINMLMIEAGVAYAIDFCEGKIDAFDDEAMRKHILAFADDYGANLDISYYQYVKGEEEREEDIDLEVEEGVAEGETVTLDNFYMLLCDYYTF